MMRNVLFTFSFPVYISCVALFSVFLCTQSSHTHTPPPSIQAIPSILILICLIHTPPTPHCYPHTHLIWLLSWQNPSYTVRCNDNPSGERTLCWCDTALKGEVTAVVSPLLQCFTLSCWGLLSTVECVEKERRREEREIR